MGVSYKISEHFASGVGNAALHVGRGKENGDKLYDVTLAGLDEEQEAQVEPMRLLEFPKSLDASGVLKHTDAWSQGGTATFVEVKAVLVDDREKPMATKRAIGLLYAAQDFYSLADFLKVHNFK
ncbi:unnamed protein product, partial [Symbiodinium pilosum]